MSKYYMCPIGQVIKVAIPGLLLLKSESEIVLVGELNEDIKLSESADLIYRNLILNNKLTYRELIFLLNKKNYQRPLMNC